MTEPFRQVPFDRLPAKPVRPHRFHDTTTRRVALDSAPFGPMEVLVREHGEGPPLLLVHGFMTASYSWRYVLDGLGAHHRLIMPDLPGHGGTTKIPDRPYPAAAMATWLGLLDALDLRGVPCVANSLGGYLAMLHALDEPDAYAKLVNVHSPGTPRIEYALLETLLAVPGVAPALAWFVRRDPRRWAHRNVHYFHEELKSLEEAAEYGAPLASREGSLAFTSLLRTVLANGAMRDFGRRLAERRDAGLPFPCPLLLLYSDRDPIVPPKIGDTLAALVPDAELVRVPDTSHFMQVDSPEVLTEHVLAFLAR